MTALDTGRCVGGCGRTITRQPMPGTGAVVRAVNQLPFVCDECATAEEYQLAAEARDREARQARIDRDGRIGASGLPSGLRRIDLARLDPSGCDNAITAARAWAARDLQGLLLTGPFGTGKTTIAAGGLWQLLQHSAGRWVSIPDLFRQLGAGFGTDDHTWAISVLKAGHALVLDDLDKARASEYGAEQIFLAIDNAVARGQQLLVTTNLSVGQLAAKWPAPFGEAIASRLVGHCTGIAVAGSDRRMTRTLLVADHPWFDEERSGQ